ncbi:synaptonemal complex protein 3-like [Bacillus rossius redtenbacheri]|uniref:synaptonemal complex protein 3-like n=1 Tax=Bacillus rossius redtenbacheri TaxID=93214 RepID=UPI002FDD5A82
MNEETHKLSVPTKNYNPCFNDAVNKTLHRFGAKANKCLLARKRQIVQLTEGAGEIYRRKLEEACAAEAEEWSQCRRSLHTRCGPVLDHLKGQLPSVEKSGEIVLKAILEQKALLQEVSKHQAEKVEQLKNVIKQFKQRTEAREEYHANLQKRLPKDFKTELLSLQRDIVQKTNREDIESMKTIMKNIYS